MSDDRPDGSPDREPNRTPDGGTETADVGSAGDRVEYLEEEVNLFSPATPFMRDNLRMIFTLFVIWAVFIFGPVTLSYVWPETMTDTRVLGGYPLNFFLTALVAPAAALALAAAYAWYRDRLDRKYGVHHETGADTDGAVAADGGANERIDGGANERIDGGASEEIDGGTSEEIDGGTSEEIDGVDG